MKKILLSLSVIFVFLAYSIHERNETAEVHVVPPTTTSSTGTTTSSASGPTPTTPQQTGQYKDGEYTGNVADAFYGNIQVKAIISGGRLTDVQFLQYPNDRPTSVTINEQAMPFLKTEAISAQNAEVNTISGATDTSEAFRQSLSSALSQAS